MHELRRLYRALIELRRTETDMADPWLDDLKVDYDEDRRWIVMNRGSLAIACNLNADQVTIPITGEPVLALGDPVVDATSIRLSGHSFAILRTLNP